MHVPYTVKAIVCESWSSLSQGSAMALVILKLVVASFPGPAQLSDTCSINNDGNWAGPGNMANWQHFSYNNIVHMLLDIKWLMSSL